MSVFERIKQKLHKTELPEGLLEDLSAYIRKRKAEYRMEKAASSRPEGAGPVTPAGAGIAKPAGAGIAKPAGAGTAKPGGFFKAARKAKYEQSDEAVSYSVLPPQNAVISESRPEIFGSAPSASAQPKIFGSAPSAAARPESHEEADDPVFANEAFAPSYSAELDEALMARRSSFQKELFRLIDRSGLSDVQVYKKAGLDRKLFSKIRCDEAYTPSKRTVLALAAALELNLDETADLLNVAGFSLSPSSTFDIIIEYCFKNGIYDVMRINELLYHYSEPLLSA